MKVRGVSRGRHFTGHALANVHRTDASLIGSESHSRSARAGRIAREAMH